MVQTKGNYSNVKENVNFQIKEINAIAFHHGRDVNSKNTLNHALGKNIRKVTSEDEMNFNTEIVNFNTEIVIFVFTKDQNMLVG